VLQGFGDLRANARPVSRDIQLHQRGRRLADSTAQTMLGIDQSRFRGRGEGAADEHGPAQHPISNRTRHCSQFRAGEHGQFATRQRRSSEWSVRRQSAHVARHRQQQLTSTSPDPPSRGE
jgi:hypothetical protein